MRLHVIAGLPRSGSTLLCNILNQNPRFYASSTSPLPGFCAQMVAQWSNSPEVKAQLHHDREKTEERCRRTLRALCDAWYADYEKTVIFDKSRGWTNNPLLLHDFSPDSKIIVTIRDLREICASFEKQHRKNPIFDGTIEPTARTLSVRFSTMLNADGMIGRPLSGICDLIDRKIEVFWLKYNDLAANPADVMQRLYCFLFEEEPFEHDYENVENVAEDIDAFYNYKFPHNGSGCVQPVLSEWEQFMTKDIADDIINNFQWFYKYFGYGPYARKRQRVRR